MLPEEGSRDGNAINGLDKRNGSGQDGIAGVPIATGERGDSSQHRSLPWTAVHLIPISVNISKHLQARARLGKQQPLPELQPGLSFVFVPSPAWCFD